MPSKMTWLIIATIAVVVWGAIVFIPEGEPTNYDVTLKLRTGENARYVGTAEVKLREAGRFVAVEMDGELRGLFPAEEVLWVTRTIVQPQAALAPENEALKKQVEELKQQIEGQTSGVEEDDAPEDTD